MADRPIAPQSRPEEVVVDAALRPRTLAEMVGQDRMRENLSILIQAARAGGEPLDHVLFYGPPGLGKCIVGSSLVLTDTGLHPLGSIVPAELQPGHYACCSATIYGTDGQRLPRILIGRAKLRRSVCARVLGLSWKGRPIIRSWWQRWMAQNGGRWVS